MRSIAWSPSGEFVAIGGYRASSAGGFANADNIRIYRFNGTSLSPVASASSTEATSLKWSPDGTVLAVGDYSLGLKLYRFSGTALTLFVTDTNLASVSAVAWHPSGLKLVASGFGSTVDIILSAVNQGKNTNPQALSRSIVFGNKNLTSNSNLTVNISGAALLTVDGIVSDESI